MFEAAVYFDQETNRTRWAVLALPSRIWYFPSRYGRKSAEALAARLNRDCK